MEDLINVEDLADELNMSEPGIKYRIKIRKVEKIYRLDGKMAIYARDADIIRNFKKEHGSDNPQWVRDFIDEVRDEMHRAEMTTTEMSEASGMSQAMVSHVINGGRRMSIKSATKLAHGLGMRPVLCLMER